MRLPRRHVAGGEMALMAVMTKAMGAFLVIMIMLLPYYTGDNAAQQTVDQANAEIDKARAGLVAAQDTLKKGRLTDAEIDELYKRLTKAQDALQEAQKLVDTLREKLDQKESQVARLEADNKSLNEQVERLKDEIEKLRRTQGGPPRVMFLASIKDCGLGDIDLYVQSDVTLPDGKRIPPPNFTYQNPVLDGDRKSFGFEHLAQQTGLAWWSSQMRSLPVETFAVWMKHNDAIAFENTKCATAIDIIGPDNKPLKFSGSTTLAGRAVTFVGLVTVTAQPDHSYKIDMADTALPKEPWRQVDEGLCEGLMCLSPKDAKDPTLLGNRFSEYLAGSFRKSLVAIDTVATRDLAALIAGEKVTPFEAYRWLQIVDTMPPSLGMDQRDDWSWIEANAPRKGMPAPVLAALRKLQSQLDATEIKTRIAALPDTVSPAPEINAGAKRFLDKGLPLDLANAFAKVVADGQSTAAEAERDPHNEAAAKRAKINQLDDARLEAWLNFLANGSDGLGGSNGWSRRRAAVVTNLATKKHNIPPGLEKVLEERIARGEFTLQEVLAKADEIVGAAPPAAEDHAHDKPQNGIEDIMK